MGNPLAVEPISRHAPGFTGPTMMTQAWRDAAFLHWAVEPDDVAPLLPPGVRPDVHDGRTWVGLIPFRMVGAGVGRGPSIPWLGTFLETNVRFYSVDRQGRRGIVFASLDATRLPVVLGARAAFGLPYRWASMGLDDRATPRGRELTYRTLRPHASTIVVRPGEPLTEPDPLADFLTARWALHEHHLGGDLYVPNVHEPWPLHSAELVSLDDALVAAAGFPQLRGRSPDSVLWSPGVHVRFGLPEARRVRSRRAARRAARTSGPSPSP